VVVHIFRVLMCFNVVTHARMQITKHIASGWMSLPSACTLI
jgi:hypothetical protein